MESQQQEAQPLANAMPPWLSKEWEKLHNDFPQLVSTVVVLLVTLVVLSFVAQFTFRRKKPKTVLLIGLNGAGKTALFYQLKDGTTHQGAVTSMEPNEGSFVLHSEATKKGKIKPVHIVDVPGHPKLRPQLEELLPKSCCLVFLVDALDFMPHKEAAAEYLYDILTNKEVVRRKIPLLLTCNKMDKVTAHSSNFIRGQLEKELNKLRKSRIAISAADVTSEIHLGVEGDSSFSFTQCSNKITIAEISALTGNVEQVEQFIREHVKQ
jgi:signal recognition particle receptor subunit beta